MTQHNGRRLKLTELMTRKDAWFVNRCPFRSFLAWCRGSQPKFCIRGPEGARIFLRYVLFVSLQVV